MIVSLPFTRTSSLTQPSFTLRLFLASSRHFNSLLYAPHPARVIPMQSTPCPVECAVSTPSYSQFYTMFFRLNTPSLSHHLDTLIALFATSFGSPRSAQISTSLSFSRTQSCVTAFHFSTLCALSRHINSYICTSHPTLLQVYAGNVVSSAPFTLIINILTQLLLTMIFFFFHFPDVLIVVSVISILKVLFA